MSLPFDKERFGKLQAGQSCLISWEKNAANLPEYHFWTNEGDKGDGITHSVNKGMKVDVIYLAFGKVSQRIISSYLERYNLCVWKTSWTATLKELQIKGQSVTSNASKCWSWYWYCLMSALRNRAQAVTVCYQHTAGSRNGLGHRPSRLHGDGHIWV